MSRATWTSVPERGSFWMMRLGIRLLNLLGYRLGSALALAVTLYFFLTGRTSRRASMDYQRRLHAFSPEAIGKPCLSQTFRHHWNFAITVMDRMWFWQDRVGQFQFSEQGREHLIHRKSGLLLMGAHMGSFDAMRAFSLEKKVKINVVMYRAHADKFNRLLAAVNPETNLNVVDLGEGGVDQIFVLKERLDAGEIVAILGDRPAPHGRKRLSSMPFLGAPAPFPQNPWILASLLECPVLVTAGFRLGPRRYHVMVEPLTDRVVLPRKTRAEAIERYMTDYVRKLENLCRDNPYQWFNFYDFWDEQKTGGT